MDSVLDTLDKSVRVPLSVQFIARYLQAGKSRADIARIANVTRQAVTDYIQRYHDLLYPLLDTDEQLAIKSKLVAIKAQRNLNVLLDDTPNKKDLMALNAISGTHIDKYQALSGKLVSDKAMLFQVIVHPDSDQVEVNTPKTIDITPDNQQLLPPASKADNDKD